MTAPVAGGSASAGNSFISRAPSASAEVISLAGGLPDTSTFPPDTFAAVAQRIAAESCAKALQYGPTEGLDETKTCIAEVMAAEGMRVAPEDQRAHLPADLG